MSIEIKKALVVGTGISGIAAVKLLLQKKVETVWFDSNEKLDTVKLYDKAPELREVPLLLGSVEREQMKEFTIAVLSPGVPVDLPMVEELKAAGVAIWGEIELAYAFGKRRLLAITGTNGKTTTTALPRAA